MSQAEIADDNKYETYLAESEEDKFDFSLFDSYYETVQNVNMAYVADEPGWKEVLTFDGMIEFLVGAINGTQTPDTKNLTTCQKKVITTWGNNAKLALNYTKSKNLWKAGWALLYMMYNIDSVTNSCLRSFEECGLGLYKYGTLLTPDTIIHNVIFNFGDIYDAIRDVILFMQGDSRGMYNLPYDAGYGIGYSIFMVMDPYD